MSPGYYAVHRDAYLSLGPKRIRLRKHDWLVTDGEVIGLFDKVNALDWIPLEWSTGQRVMLTDDLSAQLEDAAVQTSFTQLERRLQRELDTGDGSSLPDMPRAPIKALGPYLRSNRTLLGYSYER